MCWTLFGVSEALHCARSLAHGGELDEAAVRSSLGDSQAAQDLIRNECGEAGARAGIHTDNSFPFLGGKSSKCLFLGSS